MAYSNQPFTFKYHPEILEILKHNQFSIVLTTYQTGKIIFLSVVDDKIIQLPRTFDNVMGIACTDDTLSIATSNEVITCQNSAELAMNYPPKPNTYDAMYIPQSVSFTGELAIHDLEWTNQGLIGVNTRFSCLAKIDDKNHFTPIWAPPFITELKPMDYCHLNGMAVEDGEVKYVTAFAQTNTPEGWRKDKYKTGLLIDVNSNEILLNDLSMPHSPRVFNDYIYLLESAKGALIRVNRKTKEKETIHVLPGFARGLDIRGDYILVGLSKFKKDHLYGDAPLLKKHKDLISGIAIFHRETHALLGIIEYLSSVREIYDIKTISHLRPNLLNTRDDTFRLPLMMPNETFWGNRK